MAKIRKLFEFIAVLGAMSFKTPMLKTPAMIVLSNFDRSWFADWVVSSKKKKIIKNSFKLWLLGGLYASKTPHFLFLIDFKLSYRTLLIFSAATSLVIINIKGNFMIK